MCFTPLLALRSQVTDIKFYDVSIAWLLLRRGIVIHPSVCLCVSVCVSANISLELLDRSARHFVCRSAVVVARSSTGGVALRYALPVVWVTSRLTVMGATLNGGGGTHRRRSITWATGAESDVYECLFNDYIRVCAICTSLVDKGLQSPGRLVINQTRIF